MGIVDRLKKMTGTNDGYDDTYDDDYYNNFNNYDGMDEDVDDQMNDMDNTINVNGGDTIRDNIRDAGSMGGSAQNGGNSGISLSGQNIRMKIVRPKEFTEGTQIARYLLNKCTIFLNLEGVKDKETARRLIDFLFGVAFSINGTMKRVTAQAYVITPDNVDIGDPEGENSSKQQRRRPEPAEEEDKAPDFDDFD